MPSKALAREVSLSIDFSWAPTTARCFLDLSSRVHAPVRPAANRVGESHLLPVQEILRSAAGRVVGRSTPVR